MIIHTCVNICTIMQIYMQLLKQMCLGVVDHMPCTETCTDSKMVGKQLGKLVCADRVLAQACMHACSRCKKKRGKKRFRTYMMSTREHGMWQPTRGWSCG